MKYKMIVIAAVSSLVLFSQNATAGPFSNIFNKFDTNKDGALTFSEAKNMVDPFFNKNDANKDGFLSKNEQQAALTSFKKSSEKQRQIREFKRQDKDKNGKISRKEMYHHLLSLFKFMDTSKDNKITLGEFRVQSVKVMFDSRFN